jgi:hypothetical protein
MDRRLDADADRPTIQRLFEDEAALVNEADRGRIIPMMYTAVGIRMRSISNCDQLWSTVNLLFDHNLIEAAKLSSVLKVLTLIGDAPTELTGNFSGQHNEIIDEGRFLRAQLPAYLEQRHAMLASTCPLPTVLQHLVAAYAKPTRQDVWESRLL